MVSPITSTSEQLKLDDTPLKFGKYRGSTPNQVLENFGKDGAQYIVWMHKNVLNFDTCSPSLARIAAGERLAPEQEELRKAHRTPKTFYKEQDGFEDYDDDIPF